MIFNGYIIENTMIFNEIFNFINNRTTTPDSNY